MRIIIKTTAAQGLAEQAELLKAPGRAVTTTAKAGGKMEVFIDGVKLTGKEQINGKTPALKKVGNNLLIDLEGEPLAEIENFFVAEGVALDGGAWSFAASDALTLNAQGVVATAAPEATALAASSAAANTVAGISMDWLAGGAWLAAATSIIGRNEKTAPAAANDTILSGQFMAGPVIQGHQLTVQAYRLDGTALGNAAPIGNDGRYVLNLGAYTGPVILKVRDADTASNSLDFLDEGTGQAKDLNVTLMAVSVLQSGSNTVNINPVTTIAAVKLGLNADPDAAVISLNVTTQAIEQANATVAKAFGITESLVTATAIPVITSGGADNTANANPLGKLIAAISGMDEVNGGDMLETINTLKDGITADGEATVLSSAAASGLQTGADAAGTELPSLPFPLFSSGATGTVAENDTSTAIYTAATSNAEGVVYSLKAGVDDEALLSIDSATGAVRLLASADFEVKNSYSFTVVATNGAQVTEQAVVASVSDVDEFDVGAVSDSDTATDTVAENATAGTVVGVSASASDADATTNAITYSLVANANGDAYTGSEFAIGASTGIVTVAGNIDYEAGATRTVWVKASSADGSNSVQSFTINLTDVNDNAPVLTVDNATVSLAENAAAGAITGADADATDADGTATNNTVTFSLVTPPVDGSANALFAINSSTGEISLTAAGAAFIDYETTQSYTLTVKASDGLVANDQTKTVTVNVTDTTETAPSFTVSTGTTLSGQSIIRGFAAPLATVEVVIDPDQNSATANSFVYTTEASQSGVWSLDLGATVPVSGSASFAAGTLQVSATQINASGQRSDPASATFTADTTTVFSVIGPVDAQGQPLVDTLGNTLSDINESAGMLRFAVLRSGDLSGTASVDYATNGSASSADYAAASGSLQFMAGESIKIVQLELTNDTALESRETITLALTNPVGAVLREATDTVGLLDADQTIWRIDGIASQVSEADGFADFVVSRSGLTADAASIRLFTGMGTASAGADYTAYDQVLSFSAGETSRTVRITLANDMQAEANETFLLSLTDPSVGGVLGATVSTTVVDDDNTVWSLASVGDLSENAGYAVFQVVRSGVLAAASIDVSTAGGTANAVSDFTSLIETLQFAEGETTKTVQVALINDAVAESAENFRIQLSNPTVGTLGTSLLTPTIVDDDISIWRVDSVGSVSEGAGYALFTVSRTGSLNAATVDVVAAGVTALVGNDFTAFSQQLSFAEGESRKTVRVDLVDDSVAEGNETFRVVLSNASIGIVDGPATVTVQDDDQSVWSVASLGNVAEGAGFAVFMVSRTGFAGAATIDVRTTGGTASASSDYTPYSQTLEFGEGEMSKTVRVALTNDSLAEINETLNLALRNASHGALGEATASTTVLDDDQSLWSVSTGASVFEDAAHGVFTVSRTGLLDAASIDISTVAVTSSGGTDFTSQVQQTLLFAAGEASKEVRVALSDDSVAETNESLRLVLTNPTSGSVATGLSSLTMIDNEQSIWRVFSGVDVLESAGVATFTVNRVGSMAAASIRLDVFGGGSLPNGVAIAGVDFNAFGQILSFAEGEASKPVQISLMDDSVSEPTKVLRAQLSSASQGSIDAPAANVLILDDELSSWSISRSGDVSESAEFATFVVSRTEGRSVATVDLTVGGITAGAGTDFQALVQTLSFAAGETTKTVQVALLDDALAEGTESLRAVLSNPTSGSIETSNAVLNLIDDEQMTWTVTNLGDAPESSGSIFFTLSRTGLLSAATIGVTTVDLSATAGSDYTAYSEVLSFAEGEASKSVRIAIPQDANVETNESFSLLLNNPSMGLIGTSAASTSIVSDEQTVWRMGANTNMQEDNGFAIFNVSRAGLLTAATIDVVTRGGSTADYSSVFQTLSFAEGESSKTIRVPTTSDNLPESGSLESVELVLANPSTGYIVSVASSLTAFDDDQSVWTVSALSGSVTEAAGHAFFNVTRTGSTAAATVSLATANGTATAGPDYTVLSETLVFAEGEMSKVVRLALTDDSDAEGDETLTVTITPAAGSGTAVTASATLRVLDNDGVQHSYSVRADRSSVSEGETQAVFTIFRSGDLSQASTSYHRTTGAIAGSDYTAISATLLSWLAGESQKQIPVSLLNDSTVEPDETLALQVARDSTFTSGLVSASVTITDNEMASYNTFATYTATGAHFMESDGAVTFQITRRGQLSTPSVSYFRTNGGTATADQDYEAVSSRTLNWSVGESVKYVTVRLLDDANAELHETIIAQSSANADFSAAATSTATYFDDDLYSPDLGGDDSLTAGTANSSYLGGSRVALLDGNDTFTFGAANSVSYRTSVDLGSGNDRLVWNTASTGLLIDGSNYQGGADVDVLQLGHITANLGLAGNTAALNGFEIVDLLTSGTNVALSMSLADVLEITDGNAVDNVLRIMGGSGDTLSLDDLNSGAFSTPADTTTVTDVDGSTYLATTSAAGNAQANDVEIGGRTYDVYDYTFNQNVLRLFIDVSIITAVI